MKEVDIVFVGFGFGSSMVAKELVGTGLKMVGLERGFPRYTSPDFQSPEIHDELRFAVRKAMMQDNVRETITLRHSPDQSALPVRRWGAFLPGTEAEVGPGSIGTAKRFVFRSGILFGSRGYRIATEGSFSMPSI